MDLTGKADGAYRKLREARGENGETRKQGKPWSKERLARELCKHEEARKAELAAINTSQTARLNACINDLRNLEIENRRLTNENSALKAELAQTKVELAKARAKLDEYEDAPTTADDGVNLPRFLDRTKTANA